MTALTNFSVIPAVVREVERKHVKARTVGIAICCGSDAPRFEPRWGQDIFYSVCLFQTGVQPGRGAEHVPNLALK